MNIPELCVRRPVFATVLNLLVVLIGLVSYQQLTVREYPNIDTPVVSVETVYRGASAEIMESQVTRVLEDSLSGIEGIDYITSVSRSERSQISVSFRLDRDPDTAAADVRDRVARVRGQMPDAVDEPVIAKVEADAQPIIFLAFSSDRHSELELTDYADRYVQDRLQTLPGVANVPVFGERRYAMRIWLDRDRLAAYQMTPGDVAEALRRQNLEIPAGRIESRDREFTVSARTDLQTPEEFAALVLRQDSGYLVRLGDVARVELGAYDQRIRTRIGGDNAVALGVVKQSVANPLDISAAVREALPAIVESLPEGMQVGIAYDSAVFIDRSIDAVFYTIGEAMLLVVGVIFLFLRSFRATLIPLVTIPISLIGSFAVMSAMGFTVNTLTLLAMVLAIGLVVDDAIVMLENIFRHVEAGMRPFAAAIRGAREITFAIVAMTITLAAVYTPVAFASGLTGRLFTEFALTLAGTVLISGFVALTLTPAMCARMLRHEANHGLFYRIIEGGLNGLTRGYRATLHGALRLRYLVALLALGTAAGSAFLFTTLPQELSPLEDRGVAIGIAIAPEGSSLDYMDGYVRQIEALYDGVEEAQSAFVVVGFPVVNQMISFVPLVPWEERTRSQQEVVAGISGPMFGLPGVLAFAVNPPSLGQNPIDKPVQLVVQTSGTYEDLQRIVDGILAAAATVPGLTNLDTDLKLNKPEIALTVDRGKAGLVGVDIAALGDTLQTLMGGRNVTRFKRGGEQYDVVLQMEDALRRTPTDLSRIFVRTAGGEMIQLDNLVEISETVAPRELNHFNKLRAAVVNANLAPGMPLADALTELARIAAEVGGDEVQLDYAGESREFVESSSTLMFTFVLALLFIYLVLSAQFESFIDPFVIMLSVPLAIGGALVTLTLVDGTLNVYSQIGLITLIGLITKHGILIVEFANQIRAAGTPAREAVMEAAVLRLRPILMTTGAMVLGAVPLALAAGAGAESRQQIGWVIVGGVGLGSLFTLFVVPVAYVLLTAGRKPRVAELEDAQAAAATPRGLTGGAAR